MKPDEQCERVMQMDWQAIERQYIEKGWFIIDLPDPTPVFRMRDRLQQKLREATGQSDAVLERFHQYVDDETVANAHWALANFFWETEFSLEMGRAQLGLFHRLIGRDLHIQYKPYLRFARPACPQDNIGYHKDTQYGQSPYEIAVHVPFVDLDGPTALKIIEGSHTELEANYPTQQQKPSGVEKGSQEHMLGRPYNPKRLLPGQRTLTPLAMKLGQAAFFCPALFHGQEVNDGAFTRVTTDLRVVGSFAPAPFKRDMNAVAGYTQLSVSPISVAAQQYFMAQEVA